VRRQGISSSIFFVGTYGSRNNRDRQYVPTRINGPRNNRGRQYIPTRFSFSYQQRQLRTQNLRNIFYGPLSRGQTNTLIPFTSLSHILYCLSGRVLPLLFSLEYFLQIQGRHRLLCRVSVFSHTATTPAG